MMNGWNFLLLSGLIGAAVATYVLLRRPGSTPDKYDTGTGETGFQKPLNIKRNKPSKHEQHFYASSVQPGLNCCDAVKEIAHNRYLLGEEPSLPLPDCDREDCRCIMQPQDDRRANFDRRSDAFSAYGDYRDNWHPTRREKQRIDRRRPPERSQSQDSEAD